MEFIEGVKKIKSKIANTPNDINEESTKASLVAPMLRAWGYDPSDLNEVSYEYVAKRTGKKDKMDCVVLRKGEPLMLIECKHMRDSLKSINNRTQIFRYFGATPNCDIAILTNGITYKFYTDFVEDNVMDDTPFFEVDISNVSPEEETVLRMFSKRSFDNKEIRKVARDLFRVRRMADALKEEMKKPTNGFLNYMLDLWKLQNNDTKRNGIRDLVGKAFDKFCMENRKPEIPTGTEHSTGATKTATEEDVDGYHIVRAICAKSVSPTDITINPTSSSYYCAVQLGSSSKGIIRMYFNKKKQKHIEIWNGDKWVRYDVDTVSDIYKYDAEILAAVKKRL